MRSLAVTVSTAVLLAISLTGCGKSPDAGGEKTEAPKDDKVVIAMLPKLTNIAYFDACHEGAKKAAAELGVQLIYDGPTKPSGAEQNQFIDTWIRQRVDAICVAPNQPKAIQNFVAKAQDRGIKIVTWDSDAPESTRDMMVNQVDDQILGHMLIDEIARQMNEEGEWAITIASLDATNLNTWRRYAEERAKEKYPKMTLVATEVTNEDENEARKKVETLLNAYPNLKGIIGFDSNSVPGSAEALARTGKGGKVALTGNTTPGKMRKYIKDGVLEAFYLWDPRALGDLTVRVAKSLVDGKELKPGDNMEGYGELKFSPHDPKTIILSEPIRFTKDNIDQYDFGF